jgi:hypothetical protein
MIRMGGVLVALAVAATGFTIAAPSPTTGVRVDSAIASNDAPPTRRRSSSRHIAGRARLSVDVVSLKSGTTLRGAVARYDAGGSLTMAVAREWLRKASPDLFAKRTREEASVRRAALEQLRERLDKELVGVPNDSRLGAFLRSERKRAERLLAEAAPSDERQFVWLDLAKKEIAKLKPASAANRRIAAWSWFERLANVETRDADDLAHELERRGINPAQPLPDLSDRFPLRRQDDREWRARMALVVYALDKPLDFQGTGDVLVRADRSGNAKDAGPLLAKLLGGQVDTLLKDLLGENRSAAAKAGPADAWLKTAYREAESLKARGLRATRVELIPEGRLASVSSVFAVHRNSGDWEVIWSDRETQDGTKERAAMEATIADDPQVKSALANLHSLGAAADDQVRQAIRFGAATMAAQQAVDRRFFAFEGPLLQHLDGPPLW